MTETDPSKRVAAAATPEELVTLLRAMTREAQDVLAGRAKELGLGTTDFIALIRACNGEGVTGAQLAQAFGMRSSSVTALADRLETKRLIARRPHPTDRRTILLQATRRGRSAVQRAIGPLLQRLTTIASELNADQRATITAFLHEIHTALHDSTAPATGRHTRPSHNR